MFSAKPVILKLHVVLIALWTGGRRICRQIHFHIALCMQPWREVLCFVTLQYGRLLHFGCVIIESFRPSLQKKKPKKTGLKKREGGTSNVNVFGAGNNCTLVFYHTSTTGLSRVRNKKYMHRILLINTGNTKQTQSIIGMCLENRFHHWYRIILITCGNWFLYQLEFQTFETIDQKVVACDQLQLEIECRLRNN